ncbi:MAG TPA: efflux RND transporter periplasmic adaptor subunit [Longimicrobiales bacterium]|nr:efflux RND transporter periplasmic adaptor subunit [Longimicrobiales bacterium]
MKKGMKIGIGIAAIVGVVAVSMVAASRADSGGVMVRMEPVATRDLVATVTASGWIRPHRRVEVQADIMGRIIELNVKEGDVVQRGQVLLRIDPTQFEAAVSRAQAAVSEALAREAQTKANLLQAERAYERFAQLAQSDQQLVSRQQLEEAETQMLVQRELLTAAGFGVAQSRSALTEARDRLAKTVIRAPMDGMITRLNVEEGSTAIVGTTNNPGSILLTVADLSTMEAVVRVDETDVPDIHVGDSASVTIDAFPRQPFTGRVSEISYSSVRSPLQQGAAASTQGGQAIDYEIVITLDNPPTSLRSDLSVSSDIVTAKRPGALSVPIIALTVREESDADPVDNEDPAARAAAEAAAEGRSRKGDQEGVFVVRKGKAVFVPVTVGIAGQEYFEVITGVTTADTVVAGPYEVIRTLENGQAVRPMPATTPTGTTSGAQAAARES